MNLGTQETLTTIKDELGIKSTVHDDGRVILNYDQIESPKLNECVRECRGLVLDSNNDWELVARAFPRFFNLGENRQEQDEFLWHGSIATDKEDGSLIIIYYWNGKWHANTRGSYGDGNVGDSIFTWHDLLDMSCPQWRHLDPTYIYVGELCSLYNKVVRMYVEPSFYLLTAFEGVNELSHMQTLDLAIDYDFEVPEIYYFGSEAEVEKYIKKAGEKDSTYEGIVLRDFNNLRIKVKTPEYVALHRMSNNGNIASPKNLIPFILKGEEDEVLTYFPELKDYVQEVKDKIEKAWDEVDGYWHCFHDEANRKKFAQAVLPCKFSSILFTAKDRGVHPRVIWLESADFIFKVLFK